MADRIFYLERPDVAGMRRHQFLFVYDTSGDPLPSGIREDQIPATIKPIMNRPDMTTEKAGVLSGTHHFRVHRFEMVPVTAGPAVERKVNDEFKVRKVADLADVRGKRTVDSQFGVEITVT